MFSKEKSSSSDKNYSGSATLVSPGTVVKGDINSENDLRIDGTIQGNVHTDAKIIIGPTGSVQGDITGGQADIYGRVSGNVTVKDLLQLKDNGNVEGNIIAAKLQIDPTALFNGKCQMTAVADAEPGKTEADARQSLAEAEQ